MRRFIMLMSLVTLTNFVSGQIDPELSRYVDSLATADQKWRGLIRQVENGKIDPGKLNERRKQAGLSPIEEYIKMMNEWYYGTLKK